MFRLCLHLKTVSQHYFILLVYPMLSKSLQPSFHHKLASAQWHFVLVKKYQVKCMADTSHFKSIFQKLQQKLYFVCNVMCFAKIQLCYQQCVIDFVNTTFRPSLKNSLFPVRVLEKVCPPRWLQYFFFFCWIWVPKSISGPCVGKTLCPWVTTMLFVLMIRTKVLFPTDKKIWKQISLQFKKEFGFGNTSLDLIVESTSSTSYTVQKCK